NQRSAFNPITGAGMSFERRASHEATEGDVLNSAEYRSAFFKSLLGQKMTEFEQAAYKRAMGDQRADAFASSTNAAAVLPTQTLNEVIKRHVQWAALWERAELSTFPQRLPYRLEHQQQRQTGTQKGQQSRAKSQKQQA
ncbi:MAG: hypothetical protein ACLVCN_00085, partial [Phascolarctobacterium faecium]